MENNEFIEYTIINPKNNKYQQLVVNDGSDIIQVFNTHLEIEERFESEAYHLDQYAENNGLIVHRINRKFTPIEELLSIKKTKSIMKERFLYLKENIGILNRMVHEANYYKTIIKDDIILTEEIATLAKAVKKFENTTELIIKIN